MFDNRNIFDFRAVHSMDGGPHLTLVLQHGSDDRGYGVILGNDYNIKRKIEYPPKFGRFDIHEFKTLDDGNTSLAISCRNHVADMEDLGLPGRETSVFAGAFVEMNPNTGDIVYDWDSFDQIHLSESLRFDGSREPNRPPGGWDYVHANAVDKNAAGDYIMSFRYTNTIYMISGEDGRILWRLGGKESDFDMDFTFSKQHDAKFLESNGTHYVISMMNNASDEFFTDEDVSSVLIVALETSTSPMTARLLRRYNRPDGNLTKLRGNAQVLPNKNVHAGWSHRGYFTEHAEDGELLLSANFVSTRFSTYRSYKFEFTGRPSAPPDLVAFVWGTDAKDLITTFYVSWNGATDIARWNFYARASSTAHPVFIGSATKHDFETMYIAKGYLDWISVEAVDAEDNALGKSPIKRSETPKHWEAAGFDGDSERLIPDDPAVLYSVDGESQEAAGADAEAATGDGADDRVISSSLNYSDAKAKELSPVVHELYNLVYSISGLFVFVLLLFLAFGIGGGTWLVLRRRRQRRQMGPYQHVPREEDIPEEQMRLRPKPPE